MAEEQVVRSVRIPLSVDKQIRRIAEYEDRTVSKVMQRLLHRAVVRYLEDNEQFMLHDEEMRTQRLNDILEESDEIARDLEQ